MRKIIKKSMYFTVLLASLLLPSGCVYTTLIEDQAHKPETNEHAIDLFDLKLNDVDALTESEQLSGAAQFTDELIQERIISPHIAALRERYENDEIVGYLYIEGTDIRYPVAQHTDNSFYLYHNIYKRSDSAGWVFLDYENDITREDPNTIIYGHNMRQNIRFHGIRHFQDRDFFDTHRYITFNTAYGESRWEIFSFYRTNIDFFYIQVHFDSDGDFYELLAEMAARSMHESGIEVGKGDRVLTLSTCTNNARDERFVVNARLIQ
ncbi:MAG: class B sortase [Oscillospiraceae bacterium]|nr:class B sortase [Oscillospiraceae bacterium]